MTTAILPAESLDSLNLKEGDIVTGAVSNGQLQISIHTPEQISELEQSFDEARAEKPIPLEADFFDRMRQRARDAAKNS